MISCSFVVTYNKFILETYDNNIAADQNNLMVYSARKSCTSDERINKPDECKNISVDELEIYLKDYQYFDTLTFIKVDPTTQDYLYGVNKEFDCSILYYANQNCSLPMSNRLTEDKNHYFLDVNTADSITEYDYYDESVKYTMIVVSENDIDKLAIYLDSFGFTINAGSTMTVNYNAQTDIFKSISVAVFLIFLVLSLDSILKNNKKIEIMQINGSSNLVVAKDILTKTILLDLVWMIIIFILDYLIVLYAFKTNLAPILFFETLVLVLKLYLIVLIVCLLLFLFVITRRSTNILKKDLLIEKMSNIYIVAYFFLVFTILFNSLLSTTIYRQNLYQHHFYQNELSESYGIYNIMDNSDFFVEKELQFLEYNKNELFVNVITSQNVNSELSTPISLVDSRIVPIITSQEWDGNNCVVINDKSTIDAELEFAKTLGFDNISECNLNINNYMFSNFFVINMLEFDIISLNPQSTAFTTIADKSNTTFLENESLIITPSFDFGIVHYNFTLAKANYISSSVALITTIVVLFFAELLLLRLFLVQNRKREYNNLIFTDKKYIGINYLFVSTLIYIIVSIVVGLINDFNIDILFYLILILLLKLVFIVYYNYKFSKRPKSLEEFYD